MPTRVLRVALRVHGTWFLSGALFLELLPNSWLRHLELVPPAAPFHRVVFGIASAELLTGAAFFWLASLQATLPRFAMVAALVHTIINLFHNALSIAEFYRESHIWIVGLDTIVIAPLFVAYVLAAFRWPT